jgi:hypothetical protein
MWPYFIIGAAILMTLAATPLGISDERIRRIAYAISKAEGYGVAGAIPTVRNNPGNIKNKAGVIATYPTPAAGWEALYKQVRLMLTGKSAYYKPTMTLEAIAKIYTGEAAYMNWARNVARVLNVQTTTTLAEIA